MVEAFCISARETEFLSKTRFLFVLYTILLDEPTSSIQGYPQILYRHRQ